MPTQNIKELKIKSILQNMLASSFSLLNIANVKTVIIDIFVSIAIPATSQIAYVFTNQLKNPIRKK
jgi:hypothetical protein